MIHASRGSKPIYAAADDLAASAAYCIACSADQVFVTRTGAVGTIGVMSLHTDQSGLALQARDEVHLYLGGQW